MLHVLSHVKQLWPSKCCGGRERDGREEEDRKGGERRERETKGEKGSEGERKRQRCKWLTQSTTSFSHKHEHVYQVSLHAHKSPFVYTLTIQVRPSRKELNKANRLNKKQPASGREILDVILYQFPTGHEAINRSKVHADEYTHSLPQGNSIHLSRANYPS